MGTRWCTEPDVQSRMHFIPQSPFLAPICCFRFDFSVSDADGVARLQCHSALRTGPRTMEALDCPPEAGRRSRSRSPDATSHEPPTTPAVVVAGCDETAITLRPLIRISTLAARLAWRLRDGYRTRARRHAALTSVTQHPPQTAAGPSARQLQPHSASGHLIIQKRLLTLTACR